MKPRDPEYDAAMKAAQTEAKKAYGARYYRKHRAERAAYFHGKRVAQKSLTRGGE